MAAIAHRMVETNGVRMHVAEAGEGPLVVLCHGFPETWYSWRHQLAALSAAGFRVVAPDMRGYGETERPDAIDQYTIFHLVGDIVGLVAALGEKTAVIVGHDWGAPVAWHAALFRPDVFRAVAGLSVPFRPRAGAAPTTLMPRSDKAIFYQLYFQAPGLAEARFERDARLTLRRMLYRISGDAPAALRETFGMVPLDPAPSDQSAADPETLPAWLSEADVDVYAEAFRRTGFAGGLNWYRNIDRNWALVAPFAGRTIEVPALYAAGDRDPVLSFPGMDRLLPRLRDHAPLLEETVVLPGCGHWTQQERPVEVNAALIAFLERHV